MSVPTLANTWKVVVSYKAGLTTFENVFHTTAPDASAEADVANDFANAWFSPSSIADLQAPLVTGGDITVQHYDGSSAPLPVSVSGFTGQAMTGSGSPAPAAVALITTWRSGLAGRSNRGRTYLGGLSDVFIDSTGAQWASGAFPTLQIGMDAFLSALVGSTTVTGLDVYSPLHNTKAPVINGLVRRYMGTQRRRAEQQM